MDEVENELLERLDILVTSGQVAEEVREHVIAAASRFADEHGIQLTEANAGSFVTHFAMACARISKGESVTEAADNILVLMERYPDLAARARSMFPPSIGEVPEAELGFLNMYLCLLLGKE